MITLSDGTTTITLDQDLRWSDEDTPYIVQQSVVRTLTGTLDIQAQAAIKGRPITLEPEDDSSGWTTMTDTVVEQLRNWAAVPMQQLTLTLRNVSRTVIFRHQDGGLETRPVVHYRDRLPGDFYHCVIRLMEI